MHGDGRQGALAHIRVLDLSRILAGPWASQILSDFGADVIKVERPGRGDDTRGWGPPWLKDNDGVDTRESAYYLCANRGKKSISIDISLTAGQTLVRRLASKCDVVIENFKFGALARYGLDYADLKKDHAGLIYCSITGFGQTGPYRDRPGYDFMIQAMGGLMSVTGERDGQPGGGPQRAGVAVADLFTGMYAATAVLAAIAHRDRTGEGQHIDLALFDVQLACLANQAANYLISGESPRRIGNGHPNIVPYQAFATADGHIVVAVGNDAQFVRFCALAGLKNLASDKRFATNAARVAHRDVLVAKIAAVIKKRDNRTWLDDLAAEGVPCGPINKIDEALCDPQARARDMVLDLPHALTGDVKVVGNPVRFSKTPVSYGGGPPTLGQHSDAVLADLLGMPPHEIEHLRSHGVIGREGKRTPGLPREPQS